MPPGVDGVQKGQQLRGMDRVKVEKELVMRASDARQDLEVRAAAALKAVLAEVSTIKVREIRQEFRGSERGLTACVDVFGQKHTLACEVQSNGQAVYLRAALAQSPGGAAQLSGDATRVIIAPYLSPEAQALCKEIQVGFIDLEGNARLALGEVFILKQTMPPHREPQRAANSWPLRTPVAEKGSAVPGHSLANPHSAEEPEELISA